MCRIEWYECQFNNEDISSNQQIKFKQAMEEAFHAAGWPDNAVVVGEAQVADLGNKLWITSTAAQAAEAIGFHWRRFFVKVLPEAPLKKEAALVVGHKSAWNLLRENNPIP